MATLSAKVIKYLEANDKTADELGHEQDNPNVILADDGTGAFIKKWDADALGIPEPTEEQLNELENQADVSESNHNVDQTRKKAYGDWKEQLDEIYHDMDAWKSRLQQIKTNNPKN